MKKGILFFLASAFLFLNGFSKANKKPLKALGISCFCEHTVNRGEVEKTSDEPQIINLYNPRGGEKWPAGSRKVIQWEYAGENSLKIEFSHNGGDSWSTLCETTIAGQTHLDWVVPEFVSNRCLIRLSLLHHPHIFVQSPEFFSITPTITPQLAITVPMGGEEYKSGNYETIRWNASGVNEVHIDFSIDNGQNWEIIAENITADWKAFMWIIPNIQSDYCLIRVTDAQSTKSHQNPIPFKIVPAFNILKPTEGETWLYGTSQTISWSSSKFIFQVNIEISSDSGISWKPVAENLPAGQGNYTWPVNSQVSDKCLIKISNAEDPAMMATTKGNFAITRADQHPQLPKKNTLHTYPNPFMTELNILSPDKTRESELTIINSNGQVILKKQTQQASAIIKPEIGNLPPGTYIIRLNLGKTRYSSNVVKLY